MVKVVKLALFNLSLLFFFNQTICFDVIDSNLIDNSNLNLDLDLKDNKEKDSTYNCSIVPELTKINEIRFKETDSYLPYLSEHLDHDISKVVIDYLENYPVIFSDRTRLASKHPNKIDELSNSSLVIHTSYLRQEHPGSARGESEISLYKFDKSTNKYKYSQVLCRRLGIAKHMVLSDDRLIIFLSEDILTKQVDNNTIKIFALNSSGDYTLVKTMEYTERHKYYTIFQLNGHICFYYSELGKIEMYKLNEYNELELVRNIENLEKRKQIFVYSKQHYLNTKQHLINSEFLGKSRFDDLIDIITDYSCNNLMSVYETRNSAYKAYPFELQNGLFAEYTYNTNEIKIYYNKDGNLNLQQQFRAHIKQIWNLIELKDGSLASCSEDSTIKIWSFDEIEGYKLKQTLTDHTGLVFKVIQLPDGSLVSCSADNTIKIWALNDKNLYEVSQSIDNKEDKLVSNLMILKDSSIVSRDQYSLKIWKYTPKTIYHV